MANKIQKLTQSRAEVQRILNESDGLRQQVELELATLKGEGEGSVSAAVEAGVRRVLGGATEAYDTLKEIEEYIEKDEAGAVVLAQNIAKNAKAIEDSPFEKGSGENSAVLKGKDNQVISEGGVAVGSNNVVGLKGWYYKAIQLNRTTNVTFLYLSKTQQVPVIVASASEVQQEKDIDFTLISNDIVSVVNDSKYDNTYRINTNEIAEHGRIGLKSVDSNNPFPFDDVKTDDELTSGIFSPEDYSIYCLSKPAAGIADMGQDSFVSGYNNKATNGKATSFGYDNHAYGKFSFVEGRDNEAGYAAHAEGRNNIASGEQSHAEGLSTEAIGKNSHTEGQDTTASAINSHAEGNNSIASGVDSHAEGFKTKASGLRSHAEGSQTNATEHGSHAEGVSNNSEGVGSHAEGLYNTASGRASHVEGEGNKALGDRSHASGYKTITNNPQEVALGKFNKSIKDENKSKVTQFSIGIGTSEDDRKNAVEVKQNGDAYIYGIGGYDGTNPNESEDVASVINGKVDKVEGKGLSTNDYTNEDKEKTLILGPHIGNDTEEHQANLLKAISDNACYGRVTVDGDSGTYISVGIIGNRIYVDVLIHDWGDHFFSPRLARYKVVNGAWVLVYSILISDILTSSNLATQSEIDAIFDGNSEGTSSSY